MSKFKFQVYFEIKSFASNLGHQNDKNTEIQECIADLQSPGHLAAPVLHLETPGGHPSQS